MQTASSDSPIVEEIVDGPDMDLREWLVSLSFAEKDFDDIFGDSQE
jgi:hypothetical protein